MTQGGFERVLFCFAGKVISSRTEISCAENRSRGNFALQVEVVLQYVWELWVVSQLKHGKWLRQDSTLRIEKARKHIGIYVVKGTQSPIDTKQDKGKLIAKNAGSAPQNRLAVTEDVPCKASLGRKQIPGCGSE